MTLEQKWEYLEKYLEKQQLTGDNDDAAVYQTVWAKMKALREIPEYPKTLTYAERKTGVKKALKLLGLKESDL